MWNVLLDELPEEWNGYPIDSDFQTGIQISQCLADEELSETERFYTAMYLLFPDEENRPDIEDAAEAIKWFLSEYHHDNNLNDKSDIKVMDFDIDQWRIYAAFMSQYGIDLNKAKMHWFVFMGMLANVGECSFTHVMDIRSKKITPKMNIEEKNAIKKAKKIFAIKQSEVNTTNPKEQHAIDEFMKYAKINRKEP